MTITNDILMEFKERMRLEDHEDQNLMRILSASFEALKVPCGDRNIETDEPFKELVFERSRYAYNDALEYFDHNFLSRINTLSVLKAIEDNKESDSNATI